MALFEMADWATLWTLKLGGSAPLARRLTMVLGRLRSCSASEAGTGEEA